MSKRYGIYARTFGQQRYKRIKGYKTYFGACKALRNFDRVKIPSRSEVRIMEYTSHASKLYIILLVFILVIVMRAI